ncbi:MAG: hypothetical protein LM588_04990 [Fervidicoccaceae archaeon]|nr:hypothetical protein [Fervidicoccaceae archaeon]
MVGYLRDFKDCNYCHTFFAAGLAKYPLGFFNEKKGFTEIRKTFLKSDRGNLRRRLYEGR